MKLKSFQSQKGFTLIEVMVVIVIMTIMTSLVVLNIGGIDQKRQCRQESYFYSIYRKLIKNH